MSARRSSFSPLAAAAFAVLVVLVAARPAGAVTDVERVDTYRQFRALFDSRLYPQALPLAEQLVTMTEEQYDADHRELVNPLANLGTVQYRLKDYAAAEQSYNRALKIIETGANPTDRLLLKPLAGLGATQLATGRNAEASTTLKRAVDLSRNLDGLFNVGQLSVLRPLIESYVAQDRLQDAEKEHQYAFRIAETAYGKEDLRLIEPLDFFARWYEHVGRYTTARALWARALTIAEKKGGVGSVATVDPLRGFARTFQLEFLYGPERTEEGGELGGMYTAPTTAGFDSAGAPRLNPDGERALRLALGSLEKHSPNDNARRGLVLVELGDYFLCGGSGKAMDAYKAAWQQLSLAGDTSQLSAPRQIFIRHPVASVARFRGDDPAQYDEYLVKVQFTVTKDGKIADVAAIDTPLVDSLERSVEAAVRKARYAPRIENGEPVDTQGVTFVERVLVKKGVEKDKSAA